MPTISVKTKAAVALLAAGLLFGLSSPLARSMGTWLLPFSVVFVRFLFALPFALGFLLVGSAARKGAHERTPLWKLGCFAALFPISVCLYTFSLFYTKVSLAIFSFYIANVIASIVIGKLFNQERLTRNKVIGFVLTIIAVICFTNPFQGFIVSGGMVLGYLSGIFQSVASLYQKRLSKTTNERVLTMTHVLGGLGVALIAILCIGDASIQNLTWHGAALGLLFGFLFFFINYLMIYGFKRADIGVGTILLSSELVFGPVAAYFMFREILSGLEVLGGLLVIAAVVVLSLKEEPVVAKKRRD